jgi:MYXO-CTERM domain-containing protein
MPGLANAGFEAELEGWTITEGACRVTGEHLGRVAPEGAHFLWGGESTDGTCVAAQALDVSEHAAAIDAATVAVELEVLVATREVEGGFDDQPRLRAVWLDEAGGALGSLETLAGSGQDWHVRGASGLVPPGTRAVRVEVDARLRRMPDNDAMLDDVGLSFREVEAVDPGLTRRPMLQDHRQDAMRVLCETDGNLSDAAVSLGPAGEGLTRRIEAVRTIAVEDDLFVHIADMDGLSAGTEWEYRVENGGTHGETHPFRTAPPHDAPVRISWMADNQEGAERFGQHIRHLSPRDPDLLFVAGDLLGDMASLDQRRDYWWAPLEEDDFGSRVPVLVARGNHDRHHPYAYAYTAMPEGEDFYSFRYGPVFVVVLDTQQPMANQPPGLDQALYLASALASEAAPSWTWRTGTSSGRPTTSRTSSSTASSSMAGRSTEGVAGRRGGAGVGCAPEVPMRCHTPVVAAAALAGFADAQRPDAVGSVDSELVPARCHWARPAQEELCDIVIEAVETSWPAQVDGMGFHAPMPDDDGVLDLYITGVGTAGGAYALGTYEDEDAGDGRMGSHAYVALSPDIPRNLLHSFVGHEFNHVLQYGTDFTENALTLWEGSANVADWYTHDDVALSEFSMADFQAVPWAGLVLDSYQLYEVHGVWNFYEYGAMLWNLYLEAGYGGGGEATAAVWAAGEQDGWTNEPDLLDALDEVTGDWQLAWLDFALQRIRVGTADAPDWTPGLSDPEYALDVALELDGSGLLDEGLALVWPDLPYPSGAVYARIDSLPPGEEVTLSIDGEWSDDVVWGLVVSGAPEGELAQLGGTLRFTAPEDGAPVVIGAVNLGRRGWDIDDGARQSEVVVDVTAAGVDAPEPEFPDAGDSGWEESGKGCGCAGAPGPAGAALALVGLGLLGARRRRP